MASDDTTGWSPPSTSDLEQLVEDALAREAERSKRREKLARYDEQGRIVHDPEDLFAAILWIFTDALRNAATPSRLGAMWDAHLRVEDEDVVNGHLAGLLAFGITRGRGDIEAVAAAHALLTGPADDPTLAKVRRAIEQVAAYEIHAPQFDKKMKRVISIDPPDVPPVPANAVPLDQATSTLAAKLRHAGLDLEAHPTLEEIWGPFLAFAAQPFHAASGLYVDNDMCLAEWDAGATFFDLVRQWSMNDADDGAHAHMEQLHLTLHYDSDPTPNHWSGDDPIGWTAEVEATEAFGLLRARTPTQILVDHHQV